MMSQSSTVTVVLLTLEALVVVFVADVVLETYPSRHLDHTEAKDVESRHHYSASLGEIELRHHSPLLPSVRICEKRGTAVVLLALCVVFAIEMVVASRYEYT